MPFPMFQRRISAFDINGDGLITAVDASFVLSYCADLADNPDLKI